ncbi:NAD-dependent epimerase/dehydratase [Solidesulfovibrio fructosivorans JJ]]|uniref:NAD-dependent epimerase/dehydratase n=1 Tax=Solidesulfovibrio fructosivorans JJ] TaxID=596151 RepID=E1JSM7_SOLFR|nr:SDR family oxidoreductase [Solidesulfovibrio fructosivorans]EFL52510.1 NAD-dependent epimerase/dehydratase [Solidesulfovibrio fructosivorans JJ]]
MRILVTGGFGYIGSVLVPELLALGHDVTAYDIGWFGRHIPEHPRLTAISGDTRDIDAVPMAGVDAVINLANVANDPCGDLDSKLTWEVNCLATMKLAEKAVACGVKQFLHASSGSVYGVKDEPEVTEDLPCVPISDYNKTKMVSERVLLSYADKFALTIVRPATVCGYSPRMRLDVAVNLLTMQALAKKHITVLGGDQTRPNIHMKDIVRVFLHFLAAGGKYTGIYNAGFENISILDLAKKIVEVAPAEIEIKPSNDPRSYRQNSDKLLATGFTPKYGVADGIRDVAEAFRDGRLADEDRWYNIRTMKTLPKL